jgi:hypothetical protein
MTTTDKPGEVERVACEICLKEVPISEAIVPEATDYVVHFCGLECYQKWKNQRGKPDDQVETPGS